MSVSLLKKGFAIGSSCSVKALAAGVPQQRQKEASLLPGFMDGQCGFTGIKSVSV